MENQITNEVKKENKFVKWLKSISYAFLPFLIFIIIQMLAWGGNQLIYKPGVNHPAIFIDDYIPTISWFIWFYYLTFPVGALSYFYVASVNKKQAYTCIITVWIVAFISGFFYYFYPTEMIKPIDTYEIKNISDWFMVTTWKTGNPNCCLPSGHCMMAIGSFLCVYNRKEIKWWFRAFVIFSSIMTVFATVFLRQHYVLDFFASLILMVITYLLLCKFKVGEKMVNKYCGGKDFEFGDKYTKTKKKNKVKEDSLDQQIVVEESLQQEEIVEKKEIEVKDAAIIATDDEEVEEKTEEVDETNKEDNSEENKVENIDVE